MTLPFMPMEIIMKLQKTLEFILKKVVHQETTLLRLAAAALGPTTTNQDGSSLVMVFNLSPSLFRV